MIAIFQAWEPSKKVTRDSPDPARNKKRPLRWPSNSQLLDFVRKAKGPTRPGKHTKNYGKSPFLMGKLTISMAIFNSYVKLPKDLIPELNDYLRRKIIEVHDVRATLA